MNQKTKKQAMYWLKVAVVGIALGLGLQFVRAWTEPTATPPGGNLGAPINTSANPQTKEGGLLLGSSTAGGNKGAGTINADQVCIRGVCQTTWPSGAATGGGGGGGGGAPTCPCGACGDSYSVTMTCVEMIGDGMTTRNIFPIYVCTTGGWTCTSECSC